MPSPTPDDFQPRLNRWGHIWRLLLMAAVSLAVWLPMVESQVELARWLVWLDPALGGLCFVMVHFRRRWPMAVAVLTTLISAISGSAAGPSALATVSLATRRVWWQVIAVGLLGAATVHLQALLMPSVSNEPAWLSTLLGLALMAAILAWGMYIGSRRELLWTLRMRAEVAEAEQESRVRQARASERARIAREMHDVLAHRISQISMHAGALTFRADLDAEHMRESAAVIQAKTHEALSDLREVLGVLRREDGTEARSRPQPTYADIPALVQDASENGQRVELDDEVERVVPVPDAVGRALYRILQEGMTNARKHAPATALNIRLRGAPEAGIDFELTNPIGFGPGITPGAGLGLVGLAERAEIGGGWLAHEDARGHFVLRGWLPWST